MAYAQRTGSTTNLDKNVVSRKKLVGIAQNVAAESISKALSAGTDILSTEQEIRDTKRAQVLIPFLVGVKDVTSVLSEAKSGGVHLKDGKLAEHIVTLENEKVTDPMLWRPRDGEVLQADVLMGRYQNGFSTSATFAKDLAYFGTILEQGKTGVGGAKSEIVDATISGADAKAKGMEFTNLIRSARARIKSHKDGVIVKNFSNREIAIITHATGELHLENDARYNITSDVAQNQTGILPAGNLEGSPVYISKALPEGVDFVVMVKGSAVSLFALRQKMNADKVPGVDAYALSLEFDEGTGVFLPQLITVGGTGTVAAAKQDAVGMGTVPVAFEKDSADEGKMSDSKTKQSA